MTPERMNKSLLKGKQIRHNSPGTVFPFAVSLISFSCFHLPVFLFSSTHENFRDHNAHLKVLNFL